MCFPSKEIVEELRKRYTPGTRVELCHMDDFQAPPIGTHGTVRGVDDAGSIMVAWDNGSGLSVAYGEDSCKVVDDNVVIALLVAPGKEPKQVCFENTLKNLQGFVGGYLEAIYPFDDSVAIVCNEEGKLDALPLNRTIFTDYGKDIIAGNFLVIGTGEEDFCSLSADQIDRYKKVFKKPEVFKDGFYPEPFAAVDVDDLEL